MKIHKEIHMVLNWILKKNGKILLIELIDNNNKEIILFMQFNLILSKDSL